MPPPAGQPEDAQPPATPTLPQTAQAQLLPIRRSVKYVPFLTTGAILGFILGSLVGRFGLGAGPNDGGLAGTVSAIQGGGYSAFAGIAYVGALGALAGLLIGAITALALDRRR